MANRYRGEIEAELDGKSYTLVLNLGALAELEDAFACKNLSELAGVFSAGSLSAKDMQIILAAGLRGAGHEVSNNEVARMHCKDGVLGLSRIVARLLSETFGVVGEAESSNHP
ncbi:gene transfer agent family protein [Rhodobacteraceae bacterium RKSG542]|uniref:gene transfer agent family protein n=1 Tax=Pseudovibrio flavus TaxID=2529854 RepID=UPI0012BBC6D7|nr:gene transfer agent family protein [Pseudovibrio flavus]MTI17057.1 gene transfer agent family protein [Pseudovibrio flavus]